MVLEVLRKLRQEKTGIKFPVANPIDYLEKDKVLREKLTSNFQRLQEKKSRINQFLSQTGLLKELRNLQKDEVVKNSSKTSIVIDPYDIYGGRGEVILVWGSKFEVEEDHITHQKTGLFRNIHEGDYQYIRVLFDLDSSYVEIMGRNTEAISLDRPMSPEIIQLGLAKAFLNPRVEKYRSTPEDRRHVEDAEAFARTVDEWRKNNPGQ